MLKVVVRYDISWIVMVGYLKYCFSIDEWDSLDNVVIIDVMFKYWIKLLRKLYIIVGNIRIFLYEIWYKMDGNYVGWGCWFEGWILFFVYLY